MGRQDGRYHQGMSFFAVLFALLAEQLKPLSNLNPIHQLLTGWVRWSGRNFDAGAEVHARVVWAITVVAPAALVGLAYVLLNLYSTVLALVWDVAVLYLTLGFRQFSHYFTDIQVALKEDDLDRARGLLAAWRGHSCAELSREEVVRLTLEESLAASHRHVFGVAFWFMLLPGPSGAVLYRLCYFLRRRWAAGSVVEFGDFARKAPYASAGLMLVIAGYMAYSGLQGLSRIGAI